jgi:hypothetical protein
MSFILIGSCYCCYSKRKECSCDLKVSIFIYSRAVKMQERQTIVVYVLPTKRWEISSSKYHHPNVITYRWDTQGYSYLHCLGWVKNRNPSSHKARIASQVPSVWNGSAAIQGFNKSQFLFYAVIAHFSRHSHLAQ